MWKLISLRKRLFLVIMALNTITIIGIFGLMWYSYEMERLLERITIKDMAVFQAAEELETSLAGQKGFVTYYFLDNDPSWLRQLAEYRQIFDLKLNRVKELTVTDPEKESIRHLEIAYNRYIADKDRVISYYQNGERETGIKLHKEVRNSFFKILELCESFKKIYRERAIQEHQKASLYSTSLRVSGCFAGIAFFMLSIFLSVLMVRNILEPIRLLTQEADRKDNSKLGFNSSKDEIKALSMSVHDLIKDADQTQMALERSRMNLLKSEKMAMVGKLAAGTAHSIRNPLTSVKMRLFSLSRSLYLTNTQREDFDVISEEIRHIDTIVQNFLEFARPPKLKMQQISPSQVVDMSLRLLEHRLKSYDVTVDVVRNASLPNIAADPEQLKEVFVNLMINACEAMEKGGRIVIYEEMTVLRNNENAILIRISDSGPGIPESIRNKVFEPFFTTKIEGTGLGLSIATRIIEEHNGWIDISSNEDKGTSFIITLPANSDSYENDVRPDLKLQ